MQSEQMTRVYSHADAPAAFKEEAQELAIQGWRVVKQAYEGQPSNSLTVTYERVRLVAKKAATKVAPLAAATKPARRLPLRLHAYKSNEVLMVALGLVSVLVFIPFLASLVDIFAAFAVIFALVLYFLLHDATGVVTLRGRLRWSEMNALLKVLAALLAFLFAPAFLLGYMVLVLADFVRHDDRVLKQHIAYNEAALGILPPTEGDCRQCQQPLQLGAEFCVFCGTAVIERPLVCPTCAATALPDARFCPQCRTPLIV